MTIGGEIDAAKFVCVLCVAAMRRGKFWRQWGAGGILPPTRCFAAYQGYLPLIPAYDRLWMSTKIFVPFDCEIQCLL